MKEIDELSGYDLDREIVKALGYSKQYDCNEDSDGWWKAPTGESVYVGYCDSAYRSPEEFSPHNDIVDAMSLDGAGLEFSIDEFADGYGVRDCGQYVKVAIYDLKFAKGPYESRVFIDEQCSRVNAYATAISRSWLKCRLSRMKNNEA